MKQKTTQCFKQIRRRGTLAHITYHSRCKKSYKSSCGERSCTRVARWPHVESARWRGANDGQFCRISNKLSKKNLKSVFSLSRFSAKVRRAMTVWTAFVKPAPFKCTFACNEWQHSKIGANRFAVFNRWCNRGLTFWLLCNKDHSAEDAARLVESSWASRLDIRRRTIFSAKKKWTLTCKQGRSAKKRSVGTQRKTSYYQ